MGWPTKMHKVVYVIVIVWHASVIGRHTIVIVWHASVIGRHTLFIRWHALVICHRMLLVAISVIMPL